MADEKKGSSFFATGFTIEANARGTTEAIRSALSAGFASGYAAAMLEVAGRASEAIVHGMKKRPGMDPEEVLIPMAFIHEWAQERAAHPPAPEMVQMNPDETPEQAVARSKKERPDG